MESTQCIQAIPNSGDNRVIVIDVEFLKNCPRLEGATIFKKLFGLVESDDVFCYKLKKDNGYATILQDFRITHKQWLNLLQFLKTNNISKTNLSIEYLVENNSLDNILQTLEDVMLTSLKLGGIPKFETFYNEFCEKINNYHTHKNQIYNPLLPAEDKNNKFIWVCYDAEQTGYWDFHKMYTYLDGWSATQRNNTSCTWFRKLKDGTEGDIEAIYTASEVEDTVSEVEISQFEGQIQNDTDDEIVDEIVDEILDGETKQSEKEAWIDNKHQEIPYHSGW